MSNQDIDTSADAPFHITQRQVKLVYAGMMTAVMLSALDGTIVNTALTTIVSDLGGLRAYTWVGTSYLLTSTATTPLFGKLSDIYGRKRFVTISIVVFILGSLLCAMANSMALLVFARAVQGIGSGGIMAMSYVVIADIVSPRDRGKYVGAFMSVFAVSSVAGPLLGGFFVEQLTWRWIFLVNVPIGFVALAVTNSSLKLPFVARKADVDYWGAILLTGTVTSLILIFSWTSEEYGWTSAHNGALVGIFALLLSLFLWWEPRSSSPIMPLRLFRNPTMMVVLPMITILGAMLMTVGTFMPLFLQAVSGISPTNSGLLSVPMMGATTIAGLYVGRRTSSTGKYKQWPTRGIFLSVIGLALLTQIENSAYGITMAMVGMFLVGLCVGASMPVSTLAVQNSIDFEDLGIASSMVILFRSLGNVISLAAFGALVNAQLKSKLSVENQKYLRKPREIKFLADPPKSQVLDAMTDSITMVYKVMIPITIIAFVLTFFLEERPLRETTALAQGGVTNS